MARRYDFNHWFRYTLDTPEQALAWHIQRDGWGWIHGLKQLNAQVPPAHPACKTLNGWLLALIETYQRLESSIPSTEFALVMGTAQRFGGEWRQRIAAVGDREPLIVEGPAGFLEGLDSAWLPMAKRAHDQALQQAANGWLDENWKNDR